MFVIPKLFVSLHPQTKIIGLWCNGNTTDSGPVIPGSNPTNLPYVSQKTTKIASFSGFLLLFDHVRKFQCRYSVANSVTRLL